MDKADLRYYLATLWMSQDDPCLARYATLVLTRLGERGFACIEARLLYSKHIPTLSSIAAAATSLGSTYEPSKGVVRRLFDVWATKHPSCGILCLLERRPECLPVAKLHALLKDKDRGEDALRLLVLTRSWTGFGVAFRHLQETADTSVFWVVEFGQIQHPLMIGGGALLDLLTSRAWPVHIESQFVEAFQIHLPAKPARTGLERLASSAYSRVAERARQALDSAMDHECSGIQNVTGVSKLFPIDGSADRL